MSTPYQKVPLQQQRSPDSSVSNGVFFSTPEVAARVGMFTQLRADNIDLAVRIAEDIGRKQRAERAQSEVKALQETLGMEQMDAESFVTACFRAMTD